MVDKVLLELQHECRATACIILDIDYNTLDDNFAMAANVSDSYLYSRKYELPLFLEYGKSQTGQPFYFVIRNIDDVDDERQRRYISLVKDRGIKELDELLEDIVIVFTVKSKETINHIIPELYHFCVICIK